MKKFIIIYVIIMLLVLGVVIFFKTNSDSINEIKLSLEQYNEPVIDNKISIKAKEIHDYMREHDYGYCTYDQRCNHDGKCGLNVTFEASKTGYNNTCCATYVSWVLQETGYLTKQEHIDNYLNGANNLIKYLEKKGWKKIDKKDIMPGDILCYDGHIAIYGGKGQQYDAGNKMVIKAVAPCKIIGGMDTQKILRAPDL